MQFRLPVLHAAFCLPLDFVSQAVITAVFFVIHYPPNCPQVAYVFQLLLQHAPPLLLLQQGLESTITAAGKLLQLFTVWGPVAVAAASTDNAAAAAAAESCAVASSSFQWLSQLLEPLNVWSPEPTTQSIAETCAVSCPVATAAPIAVGSMLFDPPGAAVDLHTVAGRWIFASSTVYMLFAVLLVPLYVSWRLERHLKSKWMATLPHVRLQQALLQQQQQVDREKTDQNGDADNEDAVGAASSGSSDAAPGCSSPAAVSDVRLAGSSSSSSSTASKAQQQQQSRRSMGLLLLLLRPWRAHSSSSSSSSERFVYPPVVYDALPASDTLVRHLAVLFAVSVAAAQVFVQLCRLAPCLVKQVMWPQIVFK
jgi:hypothetical protein